MEELCASYAFQLWVGHVEFHGRWWHVLSYLKKDRRSNSRLEQSIKLLRNCSSNTSDHSCPSVHAVVSVEDHCYQEMVVKSELKLKNVRGEWGCWDKGVVGGRMAKHHICSYIR